MLDFAKLFREDRQLYDACNGIYDLISLSRILDYVTVLSKEKGIINKEFNDKLKSAIDKIEFADKIMVNYYTEPRKEDIRYQIYCIIKDGICKTCHIYEMVNDGSIFDQTIDKMKKEGYFIDTLAHIYCGDLDDKVLKNSVGMEFESICDAAEWCISKGKSKATSERCAKQIEKFIGTDGTAYGMKWFYESRKVERNFVYDFSRS